MSYNNYLAGESGVLDTLRNNEGRVVTIFTTGCGNDGCGFTGILARSDCRFVKLITSVPSAPPCVMSRRCRRNLGNMFDNDCNGHNILGCTCVIPVDQIVAVCFSQI